MPLEKSSGIKLEDENESVSLYTYTFSATNGVGGNGTSQLLLQNNLTDDTNMFLQGLEDGTTGWTLDGLPVLFPTDGQPILHQLTVEDSELSESEIQESSPLIETSKEITILQQQTENENQINQNENIIDDNGDEEEEEEEEEPLSEILTENANFISSVLTENGDTESTIEIPGKGFFTVSGLLFPIEQRKSIDDTSEVFQIDNDNNETTFEDSNQNSIEISELADVITAYKCKSCDYTGTDKNLFLEHYREFHLNNIQLVTLQDENASEHFENIIVKSESESQSQYFLETDEGTYELNTQDVQNIGINGNNFEHLATNGNKVIETIEEKYILLCSQCKKGFDSIDACKQHMIDDHKLRELNTKSEQKPKIISIANNTITNSTQVNNASEIEVQAGVPSESNTNGKPIIVDDPRALFEKTILKIRKTNASLPFKCHIRGCSYKFATEEIRSQHEKCHVRNENVKNDNDNGTNGGSNIAYKCSECGILQKSWRSTSLHLWRTHNIQTDLITCPVCNVFKATLPQLEHHMMTHGDKKSYCCSECGKFYKQASQLRNHRLIHLDKTSDKRPLWYREKECEQCHKIFSNSKSLKKHFQSVHSKLKPFICNVCGHSCARKAMLQMHLRQHTGEKPYSCHFCNYRTGDHNSLRRHNMKHTGIRPYKCPHCPYTSIQSNAYKYHISIKHPGKPGVFSCSLCTFKSVSEEVYINHLNDHKQGVIPPTKTIQTVSTAISSNDVNLKNDSNKTVYFYQDVKKESSSIIPDLQISSNNDRKLSVCSDNEEPCYLQYDPLSDEQCIDTGGITIPAEPECSSLLQMALLS